MTESYIFSLDFLALSWLSSSIKPNCMILIENPLAIENMIWAWLQLLIWIYLQICFWGNQPNLLMLKLMLNLTANFIMYLQIHFLMGSSSHLVLSNFILKLKLINIFWKNPFLSLYISKKVTESIQQIHFWHDWACQMQNSAFSCLDEVGFHVINYTNYKSKPVVYWVCNSSCNFI